jgi:hypothetical protein
MTGAAGTHALILLYPNNILVEILYAICMITSAGICIFGRY